MLVMAFNGSPRKNKNTGTLLAHFLEGAAECGAKTELIHLYDLNYRGCRSCFRCKRIGDPSYGICAMNDSLTPYLHRIPQADVIMLGSPVYFSRETACMRAFMERLLFPYVVYSKSTRTLFQGNLKTFLLHTMNIDKETLLSERRDSLMRRSEFIMRRTFGHCETILSTDTMQFENYDLYQSDIFDKEAKILRHNTVFQDECLQMKKLGHRIASTTA